MQKGRVWHPISIRYNLLQRGWDLVSCGWEGGREGGRVAGKSEYRAFGAFVREIFLKKTNPRALDEACLQTLLANERLVPVTHTETARSFFLAMSRDKMMDALLFDGKRATNRKCNCASIFSVPLHCTRHPRC